MAGDAPLSQPPPCSPAQDDPCEGGASADELEHKMEKAHADYMQQQEQKQAEQVRMPAV
jgi:hypothetical protein